MVNYRLKLADAYRDGLDKRPEVVGELQQDGTYVAPVENFPEGQHFIALTAVDADGDESELSNVLQFRIGVAPRPPVLIV